VLSAFALLLALLALLAGPRSAEAATRETLLRDFPCAKCVTVLPAPDPASAAFGVPVLVLLHGDGQAASTLFDAWKSAAARGIAVVSLACPDAEGCKGSYWRWNGDPQWIQSHVDALSARVKIDRARLWLAGFSGGASYLGYRTQELEKTFSTLVIHGGGMSPASAVTASDASSTTEKRRTYFLLGDKNPLHYLARQLHAHYTQCGNPSTLRILEGVDHPGEWRALEKERTAIVDWMISPP